MQKYEYDVTLHPVETFSHLVFFCSQDGECTRDNVPDEQIEMLKGIMNSKGEDGWEFVQIKFGRDGAIIFWKRLIEN